MGVYRMKVAGRTKPILLRAENKTKAVDRVVTEAKALTADEVEEALVNGESLWREGEDLPADEVAKDASGGAGDEGGAGDRAS